MLKRGGAEALLRACFQPAVPSPPSANARPSARPPDEVEGLARFQAASRHGRGGAGPADWQSWAGGGTPRADGGCGLWGVTQQSRVRVVARVLWEGRGHGSREGMGQRQVWGEGTQPRVSEARIPGRLTFWDVSAELALESKLLVFQP